MQGMQELSVSRHIAASPDAVWQAMTARVEEWWCPAPWRAEVIVQERRPGGRCAMVMHGPGGEAIAQEGIFLAWEEGRLFASTDAITANLAPAPAFMIGIWEIEPEGEGTRYTARARHWSEDARARHEEMGFTQGWLAAADQLAALCETA